MPQFREKLYNDIKNDTKPGNLLAVLLSDDIEQVTIDSSVFDVRYYYVQTPDSVWRKTDYYEVLADKHYLIFKLNDSVYQTYQYRTGEAISDTPQYNETGMEFSGWTDDIPAVMPDYDVIITGTATAVDYTIAYFINDTFVHYEVHNYNDTLTEYVPDAQEGYTFSGWTDFPVSGKMPAENIQVHGTLVENDTYTLTYYVGEEVYAEFYYKEGEEVRSAAEPEVETGYTFIEWIDEPDVMPGYDTSVNSSIIVNQYVLDYYVDSSLWKSLLYPYNSSIVPQTFERPNYVFLGWDNEPEVMPAMDYNVQGSTQQVLYNLAFYTDTSSLYAEYQLAYGEQVPQIECNKEGYVFNSWNPAVPSTMPAYDISTYATYIANSYQLKFVTVNYYDQIENLTYDLAVGQKIDASLYPKPEQYFKYKYVSENDIPEVMPASDLIIYGRYALIDASTEGFIQWYIDGEKLTNGVYAYDTSVYAPISQEENFIYLWGQYAAFTMPHQRRMDIYGERGIIPGQYSRIQWWLDDDTVPVLTQVVEWDTQVTAPVSEEDDYNYDWGTYSSFTMPRFNVDAHGTRVAKVIPHTVYWYLDSSLFTSGTYYAGTTINSPVSSEANYNYDWGAYASFSMPNYDISVYGERVSKSEPVVDSGTVTWYLDNVLFRQGTYDYDTYVMSPSSSDIKYVYEWGDYELFEMPHNDISVYGTSTKVGGTVTWYLDNAYYSSGDYLYDASVNSPVSIEANYNYNWGNYDTFRMPHYDTSVHGVREAKVVPVTSGTVTWYLDNVLFRQGTYDYDTYVTSPSSNDIKFVYNWGAYELFLMPHNDISVYGTSTQVGGTVTWYLDDDYYSSADYLYDASVTSPVSTEIGIDYNWEYDTFVMPHYDTSVHGVREEKTGPLRKVTMYVDATGSHDYSWLKYKIYEGYYHDGDMIPCPTSQDRKFVFKGFVSDFNPNSPFYYGGEFPEYTEEEVFMQRRYNAYLVKGLDASIGIEVEKRRYYNFAVAPMLYHVSVEHPTVEIGVLEPSGEVIESSTNVIDASLYFVDYGYSSIIGTNPSQVRVSMGIQVSTDGENWTLLSDNKVVMDSIISDSSIFRWDDIMHAQPYQIAKEVKQLGGRYIRLHVLEILGTPTATELANCSYYALLNYAPENMITQHYIMTLSNNQRDCKFLVLGDFDSFYEHAVEQINEHFGLTAKLTNFNISMLYNMRYADLVVEHDPNNFLTSGIRNPNGLSILTDYIDSYDIETLPVFDTTPYTRTLEINPGVVQYNYHVLDSSVIMRKDTMWSRRWANCKNIIYPQDIRVTALPSSACHQMYSGCTSLRYTPPQLCSTSLGNYAYYQMFQNCTSLQDAAELELPATTVTWGCYRRMFYNCENLENPPLIAGKIFQREALKEMFKDCKSLKSRAVINAESVDSTAFDNMYEGCTSLPPEE